MHNKNRFSEFLNFLSYLFEDVDYKRMPYKQYLNTYHWRITRVAKLSDVGFRCQLCYVRDKSLHVHHRTYLRLGREKPMDLTVLCKECHTLFHKNIKLKKD